MEMSSTVCSELAAPLRGNQVHARDEPTRTGITRDSRGGVMAARPAFAEEARTLPTASHLASQRKPRGARAAAPRRRQARACVVLFWALVLD